MDAGRTPLDRGSAGAGTDNLTLKFTSVRSVCAGGVGWRILVRLEGPGVE